MADIVPKHEISLNSEQEMILIECMRAGMNEFETCWMLKFHPSRLVKHLAANPGYHAAFKAAKKEGESVDKWELYLLLLRNGRKHRVAMRLSGFNGMQIENRRKADDAFNLACLDAEAEAFEALETEAYRRAVDGSDTMAIFLLKAGDPVKYRETQRKVDAHDDGVTSDEIDRLERGKRIAFALQLAAHGQAANDRPRDEQDPGQRPVDPASRSSN